MDGADLCTNSPLVQPIYPRGLFNFLLWYSSLYFITLHYLCQLQNENSDFQVRSQNLWELPLWHNIWKAPTECGVAAANT